MHERKQVLGCVPRQSVYVLSLEHGQQLLGSIRSTPATNWFQDTRGSLGFVGDIIVDEPPPILHIHSATPLCVIFGDLKLGACSFSRRVRMEVYIHCT